MLRLDIPITKVDVARRLVTGVATAEVADRAGEICDYATTKPLYEKWSESIAKSSGGKSFGNLRAMHGKVAAGKVTAIGFNDAARQIEIVAKVVDDAEWRKVEEGVYTGFSQGGSYAKRWTDASGATRYTADPDEISLVDLPRIEGALFEVVKADGLHAWRPFKSRPEPSRSKPPINAVIRSARLWSGDRGLLTADLDLDYGGTGQGFGGLCLYLPKSYVHHQMLSCAGHFLWRVMVIAGVEDWSHVPGRTIRVIQDRSQVEAIGHIIRDDWFYPSHDFASLA